MKVPAISVIIPCYRDAERLERALSEISAFPKVPEILVVDATPGAEEAGMKAMVEGFGARYLVAEIPSRGAQLNQGARAAAGDVFVFHHADTRLTAAHLESLERAMAGDSELTGGGFYKDIGAHYPAMAWGAGVYRFYARFIGILYGDQSCFVRRAHFEKIGGFREIRLMEDVAMSGTLRRSGKIALLDPPIRTSMRKFRMEGVFRRKVQNVALVFLFRIGVSPDRLYGWYYRNRSG
jgi:rSAM/selenodomain-associated transferase 2